MFADDYLIFGNASPKAARNIAKVLDMFVVASSQHINHSKSSLYFSPNTNVSLKREISSILQQRTTIGKYLGTQNIFFWKDPINSQELLKKVANKLSGWKMNTPSRAGRLTLITSQVCHHVLLLGVYRIWVCMKLKLVKVITISWLTCHCR